MNLKICQINDDIELLTLDLNKFVAPSENQTIECIQLLLLFEIKPKTGFWEKG